MTINPEKIQTLKNLDQDGSNKALKEMILFYLTASPDLVKKLIEFFYLKDLKNLHKEAKNLIALSEMIGAENMITMGREIEIVKDSTETEDYLRERIKKLKPELEAIKSELSVYL